MDAEKIDDSSILSLSFSKGSPPIFMSVNPPISPRYLNSVFCSLFDRPPSSVLTLRSKGSNPSSTCLPYSDIFTPQPSTSCDLIFGENSFLNVDERISALISAGVPIPSISIDSDLTFFLFEKKNVDISSYQSTIFLQRLLSRAIIDIINGCGSNQFTVSIVRAMNFKPEQSIFKPEIVMNALVDVIINVFGETCLWDDATDPLSIPQFQTFVGLIAAAVARAEGSAKCIRYAIDKFCPSAFGDEFIMLFVEKLQQRLNPSDCFRVLSDIFGDLWLMKSFRSRQILTYFVLSKNNVAVLPYVAIYCIVSSWAHDGHDVKSAAITISQIGGSSLFVSRRLAKVVMYPILDAIYSQPLSSDLPYLEMTDEQLKAVNKKLKKSLPILKVTVQMDRRVQLSTLNCVCNFIGRHNFEPKGLLLAFFSFFYENSVIHSSVFNAWMQQETDVQQNAEKLSQMGYGASQFDQSEYDIDDNDRVEYKYSALLEVNSMLMMLIPGAFPTHIRTDFGVKRPAGQAKAPATPKEETENKDKEQSEDAKKEETKKE